MDSEGFDIPIAPSQPESGFTLFGGGTPWQLNACLNYSSNQNHAYIEGYRQAADRLVSIVEQGEGTTDCLVYPIVFLYRQHLELQLKEILALFKSLRRSSEPIPGHHKVQTLWRDCRSLITIEDWASEMRSELETITEVMKQLSEVDPNADAFRYRMNSKGEISAGEIKLIHLGNLSSILNWTSDWLDGVICGLHSDLDACDEMRSYSD